MRLTETEVQVLHDLIMVQVHQMRKAERVGMNSKLAVYRARIDALDKVIDTARVEAADEVARVTQRLQEGRY